MKLRSCLIPALALSLAGVGFADPVQASLDLDSAEAIAQERRHVRAQLDADMLGQERSVTWASQIERELKRSLAQVRHLDLEVREIRCRTSLCRVILDHRSQAGQQEVLQETAGTPGFDLPGLAHLETHQNGTATSYIYLRAVEGPWLSPGH